MATIGTIAVNLTARTSAFDKKLNSSRRQVNNFASGVTGMAKSMRNMATAALAAAGVGGLGYLFKSTMTTIDKIGKMSDELQIATESLLGLEHAAKINGSSLVDLHKGLQIMVRRLGEAKEGYGEGKKGLDAMNISAEEMISLGTEGAFMKIAAAVKGAGTAAEKSNIAYQMFGRGGVNMINLLDQGTEGIQQLMNEANALGIAYGRVDASKIEAANDAMERAKSAVKGLWQGFVIDLAPAISKFAKSLTNTVKILRGFEDENTKADTTAQAFAKSISSIAEIFKPVATMMINSIKAVGRVIAGMSTTTLENLTTFLKWSVVMGTVLWLVPKIVMGFVGIVKAIRSMIAAKTILLALSGPAGWATLAAGIAVATGTLITVSSMLGDTADEADRLAKSAQEAGDRLAGIEGAAGGAGKALDWRERAAGNKGVKAEDLTWQDKAEYLLEEARAADAVVDRQEKLAKMMELTNGHRGRAIALIEQQEKKEKSMESFLASDNFKSMSGDLATIGMDKYEKMIHELKATDGWSEEIEKTINSYKSAISAAEGVESITSGIDSLQNDIETFDMTPMEKEVAKYEKMLKKMEEAPKGAYGDDDVKLFKDRLAQFKGLAKEYAKLDDKDKDKDKDSAFRSLGTGSEISSQISVAGLQIGQDRQLLTVNQQQLQEQKRTNQQLQELNNKSDWS